MALKARRQPPTTGLKPFGIQHGVSDKLTERAKLAQEQIDLHEAGGGDPGLMATLMNKDDPRHQAAVELRHAYYKIAAERVSEVPDERIAQARADRAALDAINNGTDLVTAAAMFDPSDPVAQAKANETFTRLGQSVVDSAPMLAGNATKEEAEFGFHLTDRERRGSDPLPDPLPGISLETARAEAGRIEASGAYYDKSHPHHEDAVADMHTVHLAFAHGERIASGESVGTILGSSDDGE
jgi:hypothetical protein